MDENNLIENINNITNTCYLHYENSIDKNKRDVTNISYNLQTVKNIINVINKSIIKTALKEKEILINKENSILLFI